MMKSKTMRRLRRLAHRPELSRAQDRFVAGTLLRHRAVFEAAINRAAKTEEVRDMLRRLLAEHPVTYLRLIFTGPGLRQAGEASDARCCDASGLQRAP